MALHRFKKGLDLPVAGKPEQQIEICRKSKSVALVAEDYVGMKPTMLVQEGDQVRRGQKLFEDKKRPGVFYTAPGAGTVTAINRGARRALQTVVIELSSAERAGKPVEDELQQFETYQNKPAAQWQRDELRDFMIESGQWPMLRQRPFGRVADPAPDFQPRSLFVRAIDTNPLAPDPQVALQGNEAAFEDGLRLLAKLLDGPVFLCKAPGAKIPAPEDLSQLHVEEFEGPHPAGTVGLHIHTLDPAFTGREVWYTDYQEVVALGKTVAEGSLAVERVVALAGPQVERPRLVRTRWGASLDEIVEGELLPGENRVVSGSLLNGRAAVGKVHGYLGRYDHQLLALVEGNQRELLGWLYPGANKFSVVSTFLSSILPKKEYAFDTSKNGSPRAIVPIEVYEKVVPLDIQPTYLVRSLAAGDIERAEQLGALELEEEDLALCTFVDPGKNDFCAMLRDTLTRLEKEG